MQVEMYRTFSVKLNDLERAAVLEVMKLGLAEYENKYTSLLEGSEEQKAPDIQRAANEVYNNGRRFAENLEAVVEHGFIKG